jgi:hypothetical protein
MNALLPAFAAALRAPGLPPPPGLCAWNGSDVRTRFNVHRNTYFAGLVQALGDTLPVCRQALGDEAFDALAKAYVSAEPPRSPVLATWGQGFDAWVRAHPQASLAWPWLADLARLERARAIAWTAADAPAADALEWAALCAQPERLARTRFTLHPSCQLLRFAWGVVDLWAAHQGAEPPADLAVHEQAQAALVLRDDAQDGAVLVLRLDAPAAAFVERLALGQPLGEAALAAAQVASTEATGFDLAACLALLIRHHAIAGHAPPGDLS